MYRHGGRGACNQSNAGPATKAGHRAQHPLSVPVSLKMTTVREINDPAELNALAPAWRALLPQTPGATFFQSPEWLATYLRHFGAGSGSA